MVNILKLEFKSNPAYLTKILQDHFDIIVYL